MKKAQLSIYLDPETFKGLDAFAKRHGRSRSLVAEAAVASILFRMIPTGARQRSPSGPTVSRTRSNGLNAMTVLRWRRSRCLFASG